MREREREREMTELWFNRHIILWLCGAVSLDRSIDRERGVVNKVPVLAQAHQYQY